MADTIPLGTRLRERRRALDLHVADVAQRLGVSQPTLSDWENGSVKPRDPHLTAIADFLGVTRAEVVLMRAGEDPALVRKVDGIEERIAALETAVSRLRLPPDPPDSE